MCLSTVNETVENPTDEIHTGYKVCDTFYLEDNRRRWKFFSPPRQVSFNSGLPCNEWMEDKMNLRDIPIGLDDSYPSGFHVFTNRKDAESYRKEMSGEVVDVKYARVVARGIQLHNDKAYNVDVARKIFVKYPLYRVCKRA
jgi:hypothetical protein